MDKTISKKPLPPTSFITNPIKLMEIEHHKAADILVLIRNLTDNYTIPKNTCTTFQLCYTELKEFERNLHLQLHLENNILFPKTIVLENILRNKPTNKIIN